MPNTTTRTRITKRKIDAIPHPTSGEQILRDLELPGFALRVTTGAKTFVVEKRIQGRLHKVKVGPYGSFTVDQAREEARTVIGKLLRGEPLSSQRGDLNFGEFADFYLEKYAHRKKSLKNEVSILNKHLSHWRHWKLSSISRKDVALLHAQIGKQHPTWSNRVLALLRKMFNLAINWGMLQGENPASKVDLFPEKSRDRFVQPDELPRLFSALKAHNNPYVKTALIMSLLTGARRAEVLSAKWEDINLTVGTWHIPQTKAGHWHLLPLPSPLKQILVSLPRIAGNPHVFPGRNGESHLKNLDKAWKTIRQQADLPDLRVHDLRRSLGSWLAGSGTSLHVIGKILNHSQPSTTAIYSRLNLDPLRQVLEENAERMMLVGGDISNGS